MEKGWKFVLGLPKWIFLAGKTISRGEKIRKIDIVPSKKFPGYAPDTPDRMEMGCRLEGQPGPRKASPNTKSKTTFLNSKTKT